MASPGQMGVGGSGLSHKGPGRGVQRRQVLGAFDPEGVCELF